MTTASEYARIFRAAHEGVDRTLPWNWFKYLPENEWAALHRNNPGGVVGPSYHRADYAQQEAIAAAFGAIADMFDKIAEAEGPTTSGTNSGNCEHKGTSYSNTLGTFCGDCHERI